METKHQNTALLIMDMQVMILRNLPELETLTGNVAKALAYAHGNHIPVIYVTVGFRNGTPEISRNNAGFYTGRERFANVDMSAFAEIQPEIAPGEGEIVVVKRRVSAFTGSDLEVILRAQGIQHMVLCGVGTGGVVLSTVREAADKDYSLTVLADCCADRDAEVHRVLTAKVFPRQAEVLPVEEWINR